MSTSTYKIEFADAVKYIHDFTEKFDEVSKNESLGGLIKAISIDGEDKSLRKVIYTGNMAWFCYNYHGLENFPKLFLAFEENENYEPGKLMTEPDNDVLMCPKKEFVFTYDGTNIESFIKNQKLDPITGNIDQKITKEEVKELHIQYKIFSQTRILNFYPYGFFENKINPEVEEFLQQPNIHYIRYYFGYSGDRNYEDRKLRIILFGANEKGENLIPEAGYLTNKGNGQIVLQRSWP